MGRLAHHSHCSHLLWGPSSHAWPGPPPAHAHSHFSSFLLSHPSRPLTLTLHTLVTLSHLTRHSLSLSHTARSHFLTPSPSSLFLTLIHHPWPHGYAGALLLDAYPSTCLPVSLPHNPYPIPLDCKSRSGALSRLPPVPAPCPFPPTPFTLHRQCTLLLLAYAQVSREPVGNLWAPGSLGSWGTWTPFW